MKKTFTLCCTIHDSIQPPVFFNTLEEAQNEMLRQLRSSVYPCAYVKSRTNMEEKTHNQCGQHDLSDISDLNAMVKNMSAWCEDTNHQSRNWKIFEQNIPI